MVLRVAAIIHASLGCYLEEANAHTDAETDAADAVVLGLFPKQDVGTEP
jgi:hypothetical protein